MKKETATKVQNDVISRLIARAGFRKVGRDIAEVPEKDMEINHGKYDRRTIENIVQNID